MPYNKSMKDATSHRQSLGAYGREYQLAQADKYRNREHNHWRDRIALGHRLVSEHALPRMPGRDKSTITLVDVGCSIGTFAIEFAREGYRAVGVDFDAEAIGVARGLAAEEGARPEFLIADVAEMGERIGPVDIAVCFDIFEHLHDDELGVLLRDIRGCIADHGTLVFHTFPTEYDFLFFGDGADEHRRVLREFAAGDPERFDREARAYAEELDAGRLREEGRTRREWGASWQHCNLLTARRLGAILGRAGWEVPVMETAQLYPVSEEIAGVFAGHPIVDRNLFGVATPRV